MTARRIKPTKAYRWGDTSLKIWRSQYQAVLDGYKTFEFRKEDRCQFTVGDVVVLEEWNEDAQVFTGRKLRRVITYVARNVFGIPAGHCVFSMTKLPRRRPCRK